MSNQWLRAFRFAAQNPRRRGVASRLPTTTRTTTTRLFQTIGPSRAPDDSGSEPRGGRRKPENGAGNEVAEAAEENLPGENVATMNSESQGRRRTANGPRSRGLRARKSNLPAVPIPKSFFNLAINRHSDLNTGLKVEIVEQQVRDDTSQEIPSHDITKGLYFQSKNDAFMEAASWSQSAMEEALEILKSTGDIDPILKRTDMFSVSAYWAIMHHIKGKFGENAYSQILKSSRPRSLDWVTALLKYVTAPRTPALLQPEYMDILLDHVASESEIPLTKAALFEPCIIDELVTTISAEFSIRAPDDSRLTNLRRPITLLNVQDRSGFPVAQEIIQHVAQKLEADVLHLRAHDIAHIVGRYIGQDITRSPGDISLLGFKAAENSGRLRSVPIDEQIEDTLSLELPFAVMLRDEKTRKDSKRQTVSMDEFLTNSGTRGKSDEYWDDLKVNAALDELVHSANPDPVEQKPDEATQSANSDAVEQKPLIIHINDYIAINMDETGAALLGKIRKNVDELWLSGRKVVLVGSCSIDNAPVAYQAALGGLEAIERVVHLSKRHFHDAQARDSCKSTFALWERESYLNENDENITRMLCSMTESSGDVSTHSGAALGLIDFAEDGVIERPTPNQHFEKFWSSVLPIMEIYRIATMMIGLSSTSDMELFGQESFDAAVRKTAAVDAARERAARSKSLASSKEHAKGDSLQGARRMDPFGVNHEERLLSGLINAQDMRTTFKDIHAPPETVESIKMLTTLSLVRPEAFTYGVLATERIPGCLLYGPPGTGKTLLAKAVAKESGANMIEVSGASINNMYVGESEKNVRALFQLAKKKEPMVIFIDEADALLGARGGHLNGSRRDTINQFLREWDGMDRTKAFIMVATNRPFDLDEAVLRRLPRKLLIDLPLETDRAAILRIHLKDEIIDETVSIEDIAKRTPLYSGSDLKNVSVAAAMAAVKEELEASERHTGAEPYKWAEKRVLSHRHFDKALKEIGASVSEDMATLAAIRKFDERYGDSKGRKKRKGMGFEVVTETPDSDLARVRSLR